jgi:hypothetical protein
MIDTHIGSRSGAATLVKDLIELAEAECLDADTLIGALASLQEAIEREVI